MLRGEEEGGNEPCEPAVDLFAEARHGVTEIGRQFGEGNGEREKEAQHERPCWDGTKHHIRGDHSEVLFLSSHHEGRRPRFYQLTEVFIHLFGGEGVVVIDPPGH